MKVKCILFMTCILILGSIINKTFAADIQDMNTICNFYITDSNVSVSKELVLISPDFCNEKNINNKKVAPGTSGSFIVNIDISQNTYAEYLLFFDNFSNKFPKNLQFYLDGKAIDIYSFSLTNTQESKLVTYLFTWNWDYESENDNVDLEESKLGDLRFDIVLSTEYGSSPNKGDNNSSVTNKEDSFSNENIKNPSNINENREQSNNVSQQILPRSGDLKTNF